MLFAGPEEAGLREVAWFFKGFGPMSKARRARGDEP